MNWTAWLIAFPLVASPLVYLAGHFPQGANRIRVPERVCWWMSMAIAALMWLLLAQVGLAAQAGALMPVRIGVLALEMDGLSLLLALLALTVYTLVLVYSSAGDPARVGDEKFYAMLLATTGAMIGMGCARDLFNLWVWFEAMVLSSFLLVSFHAHQLAVLDASIKYLAQSAVGSLLIVLAIALILAARGTLALDVSLSGTLPTGLLVVGALLLVGFGIKCALVPLHTWLPDVYAAAPTGVSAFLSGAVTISGLIVLVRALSSLMDGVVVWGVLLLLSGMVNTLVGNLLAFRQTELKRMLAYSSISHIGTVLLGVGAGLYAGLPAATQAGLFTVLALSVMETLAFLAVGALLFASGGQPLTVTTVRGFAYRYPLPGFALVLAILSLAGLPPLAGFIAKWQVLAAGFASPDPLVRGAVIFAALNILLAIGYYLPVLMNLLDASALPSDRIRQALPMAMRLPLIVLCALILWIGLWPDSLRGLTKLAAAALLPGGTP